jgi:hypothetical protein
MSRLSPLSEGKEVRFKFAGDRVEIVEEGEKVEDKELVRK